jgi:menaquinone-dependent protoporphyrinogen oxidase
LTRLLLPYKGIYGQTRRICERLQAELAPLGVRADVMPLEQATDLAPYDACVLGASIRHGKHHPSVLEFIRRHRGWLESHPSGFFSVNLVARKPEKNMPETNQYVRQFVASSPWKPPLLGVFGGELDYPRYGFVDRTAIRFIMWLTKGPTDVTQRYEFTDWAAVQRFAVRIADHVRAPAG